MERLSHAVKGDFPKSGEGRLGGYGAEVWVGVERLEELRGSHGFGETEDAAGMILRVQEVEPLVNVVAFEESVGGERAAADTVSAGVGKEHGESVGEKELRVSGHADAVVAEAVEKEDCASVSLAGTNFPSAKDDLIWRSDGNVVEFGVQSAGGLPCLGRFIFCQRAAGGVECAVSEKDASDDRS